MVFSTISLIYYWIKNHIKPIELPKYKWFDNIASYSLIDSITHIKFYATKNWVEIYAEDSIWFQEGCYIPHHKHQSKSIIVPKWKIKFYGNKKHHTMIKDGDKKVLEFIGVSKKDYERYLEWDKE